MTIKVSVPRKIVAMKIWLDTEFNGWGGELISLALVAEDGSEFYEVLECSSPQDWVMQNVIPNLAKAPKTKEEIQLNLCQYFSKYKEVFIAATWPDDFRLLMDLLITGPGYKLNTPEINMRLIRPTREGALIMQNSKHNALDDARLLKFAHPMQ